MALTKVQADGINLADTFAFTAGNVSGVGEITHIDQWRLTSSFTGDVDPITSNLERVDTDDSALVGSAMTQSSGIFTFPVTGIWQISMFSYHQSSANNNDAKIIAVIHGTTDGTNFSYLTEGGCNTHGTGGAARAFNNLSHILDVQNVSTHKVKFSIDAYDNANTTTYGGTAETYTGFTFVRLGDT